MTTPETRDAYVARWVPLYQSLRLSREDAESRARRKWREKHAAWTPAQVAYIAEFGMRAVAK